MIMDCCKNCVYPKRHVACWDDCPEYIAEKAEYNRRKAAEDQKNAVAIGIYQQKSDGVRRAMKRHGSK